MTEMWRGGLAPGEGRCYIPFCRRPKKTFACRIVEKIDSVQRAVLLARQTVL
jgi:hypothetical protein